MAAPPPDAETHQVLARLADQQDTRQHGDQPDVDAHIAVEDVTELVGDDPLEFIAAQGLQRTPCHNQHRLIGLIAGHEGVDRHLLVHHEQLGDRNPARQGHLLGDIAQLALATVPGIRRNRPGACHACDPLTAPAEIRVPVERPHGHNGGHGARHDPAGFRKEPVEEGLRVADPEHVGTIEHSRDRQDDQRQGQQEQQDQDQRLAPRPVLAFEKAHGGPPRQLKDTDGGSFSASVSNSSSPADLKAKNPAMKLLGNFSR